MKINFKIKNIIFLFFFLSLFKYEIVNSEEKKEKPYIKGEYLVCANGKALPLSAFGGRWLTVWKQLETIFSEQRLNFYGYIRGTRDWWLTSEVIIGKEPKRYSEDQIEAIVKKFMEGIDIPSSYKSTSIEVQDQVWDWKMRLGNEETGNRLPGVVYNYKNSENKKISIRNISYPRLIDNNGDTLKTSEGRTHLKYYCKNDYIVLRAVQELKIRKGQAKNEFGEEIKFPAIFWIREIGLKTETPTMEKNNFEF